MSQCDIIKINSLEGGPMKKEKSCGAVIFRKHQDKYQYVLIQQKFTLEFGFPKGHIETNETEVMTAIREVKEETGLEVEIFDDAREVAQYSPRPGVLKNVVYFLASAKTEFLKKQATEINDVFWVDEKKVIAKLSHVSDRNVFRTLVKNIRSGKNTEWIKD